MQQSGVTLLELLIAVAIAAILTILAIPGFASLVHSTRLTAATNEMLASLHLARSEAIKRGSRTVLCPSVAGSACAGSGDWEQGWVVFHDANNNAAVDDGETVIQTRHALPVGLSLKGNAGVASYISYAAGGGTQQVSGAWQAGTLTLCNRADAPGAARRIIISSTGRPRSEKTTVASCP